MRSSIPCLCGEVRTPYGAMGRWEVKTNSVNGLNRFLGLSMAICMYANEVHSKQWRLGVVCGQRFSHERISRHF